VHSVRPSPPFELRPATEADRAFFFTTRRDGFRALVEELGGWDDVAERAKADREFDELPVQIVLEDGEPVGYFAVLDEADHVFLDEVVIAPHAQRRGLGTALVRGVLADAARRGVPVRLSVLVNNPARRLYERLGFRVTQVDHPRVRMEWTPTDGRTASATMRS
jgi:ribosomal protein S18 acetylase RimI-like enzyme